MTPKKCFLEAYPYLTWGGSRSPPQKVLKMPNFYVVMTTTMARNIFEVIQKFQKNLNIWVLLESLLQLERFFDCFKA